MKYRIVWEKISDPFYCGNGQYYEWAKKEIDQKIADLNKLFPQLRHWAEKERIDDSNKSVTNDTKTQE